MKVAVYARVSKSLEQNPENQLLELRKWAKAMNYEIIGEYIDEVSSKDTRPQKESVLKLLRSGQAQGVAFYSLDRWGRNMTELVLELEEFSQNKIMMFSLKESIDLSSAAGRLFANVLASMANFERDRNRERTLLGLARAKARGKKLGRPRKNRQIYVKPQLSAVRELANKKYSIRYIAGLLGTSKYWIEVSLKELKEKGEPIDIVSDYKCP